MKKKCRYIEEIYTNKYKTLYQAILIDTWLDEKSRGRHSMELRTSIIPDLTILLKRRYLTDISEVLKEEIIGDDEE